MLKCQHAMLNTCCVMSTQWEDFFPAVAFFKGTYSYLLCVNVFVELLRKNLAQEKKSNNTQSLLSGVPTWTQHPNIGRFTRNLVYCMKAVGQ